MEQHSTAQHSTAQHSTAQQATTPHHFDHDRRAGQHTGDHKENSQMTFTIYRDLHIVGSTMVAYCCCSTSVVHL